MGGSYKIPEGYHNGAGVIRHTAKPAISNTIRQISQSGSSNSQILNVGQYGEIAVGMTGAGSAIIYNVFSYYSQYSQSSMSTQRYGYYTYAIDDIYAEGKSTASMKVITQYSSGNVSHSLYGFNRTISRLEVNGGLLLSYPYTYAWTSVQDSRANGNYTLSTLGGLGDMSYFSYNDESSRWGLFAEQGRSAGTSIIQLSNYKYLLVSRGYKSSSFAEATNANYQYRSLVGAVKTATGLPPTSAATSAPVNFVTNNTSAAANENNYTWVRGTPISSTQAFILARLYTAAGESHYHAMVLNVGTSSITVAKEATGAWATYTYNDMVSIDSNRALFVGSYSSYVRFSIWSYSSSAISVTNTSYTSLTDIVAIAVKMIGKDSAMVMTVNSSGQVYATFLAISGTSITVLSSNLLFTEEGIKHVDFCKVSDSKYLVIYNMITGESVWRYNSVFTRILTLS